VKGFLGMRKVEIKKDEKLFNRIFLNNKNIFSLGVLDKGFWPDGITPRQKIKHSPSILKSSSQRALILSGSTHQKRTGEMEPLVR